MDTEKSRKLFHDLKNDFAAMTAIINLHKIYKDKYSAEDLLDRIGLRQMVISVAYEKLYQTGNYPQIQYRNYLTELISRAERPLSGYSSGVKTVRNIGDFDLSLKKALPSAQIIIELLSNSYRHAFENGNKERCIEISVIQSDGSIKFNYSDSGCGFPEGFNPEGSGTLGIQFIHSIVKQLGNEGGFCGNPFGSAFSFIIKD